MLLLPAIQIAETHLLLDTDASLFTMVDAKTIKMYGSLGSLFAMNYLDFEDKFTEYTVLALYIAIQVGLFSLYGFLYMKIQANESFTDKKLTVKAAPLPMG